MCYGHTPAALSCGTHSHTTSAAPQAWTLQLNPSKKQSACSIHAYGEQGDVGATASNVLFGDVFFCSGQSNMVFPLGLALNASEEIAAFNGSTNFRFFMQGVAAADKPQFDLPEPESCGANVNTSCNRWLDSAQAMEVTGDEGNGGVPNNFLSSFSAICFLTVRDIDRLHTSGRVVGLVQSAVGGTRIEAWMSSEAIQRTRFAKSVPAGTENNRQSVLYNAMVAPWSRYAVRAAIWYQGEAKQAARTRYTWPRMLACSYPLSLTHPQTARTRRYRAWTRRSTTPIFCRL